MTNKGTRTAKYTAVAGTLLLQARGLVQSNRTEPFDMLVSWSLFLSWLILNTLDIIISVLATRAGAVEIGLLYQVSGTWLVGSINKMMLATLIGVILLHFRKNNWLSLLNLGILGVCIYNGYVLFKLLP